MARPILRGLDASIDTITKLCSFNRARYRRINALIEEAESMRDVTEAWTDSELEQNKERVIKQLRRSRNFTERDVWVSALSILSELSDRVIGYRPYNVQLFAAMCIVEKCAVKMATGEGKTLTVGIAAIFQAWRGRRCHLVTANDYLAQRDAESLESLYREANVSSGYVVSDSTKEHKNSNYQKQIVYSTSNCLLGDYLRERLNFDYTPNSQKQRINNFLSGSTRGESRLFSQLDVAIIDEADSILADFAATPLIISMQKEDEELFIATKVASQLSHLFILDTHVEKHDRTKSFSFTKNGLKFIDELLPKFPASWAVRHRALHAVSQALIATFFYEADRDYIVQDGKVILVDTKTGRLLPNTHLSFGLHQAIESKEGLDLTAPSVVSGRMNFQNFFRRYESLSGISGTFEFLGIEMWRVYRLNSLKVMHRLPVQHENYGECFYRTLDEKWAAIIEHVKTIAKSGRPILVGTTSIQNSRILSNMMKNKGINHVLLNASNQADEVNIIKNAGRKGRITIATNMAGRGTDIKPDERSISLGGLHVVSTEKNLSKRVDLQLYGRASRQGNPGSSISFSCLEDPLYKGIAAKGAGWVLLIGNLRIQSLILSFLSVFIQWRLEKKNSKKRIKSLINEEDFNKMVSFSKVLK